MNKEFRELADRNNYVVLDTETTGLERPAEICQIAIIASNGAILLDTLVKPVGPIPNVAISIHGIDNDMVKDAPSWPDVRDKVLSLITGRDVVVYNALYDRKLMHLSDEAHDQSRRFDYSMLATWYCAMLAYAEYYGEINPRYGSFRWQTLSNAMRQQHLPVVNAHSALADAQMTRRLMLECCSKYGATEGQEQNE